MTTSALGFTDPEDYRRALAKALLAQSLSPQPIRAWTEGAAKLAQALSGGFIAGQDATERDRATDAVMKAYMGGGAAPPMGNVPPRMSEATPEPSAPVSMPGSSGSLTYAGDVPLPPPRPTFDRSRLAQELQTNPALVPQLASMVRGEVGDSASPEQKAIQLETLFNRTQAQQDKGMTLARGLSNGYYPPQTFARGPGDVDAFRRDILPAVLRGSDISGQTLGFPATGNASGSVAQNGVNNGRYSVSAPVQGPGGTETYVQQPNIENIARLEQTRLNPQMQDANGAAAIPPTARPTQFAQAPTPTQFDTPQVPFTPEAQRLQFLYQNSPVGSKERAIAGQLLIQEIQKHRDLQNQLKLDELKKQNPDFYQRYPERAAADAALKKRKEEEANLSPDLVAGRVSEKGMTAYAEGEAKQKLQKEGAQEYRQASAPAAKTLITDALGIIDKNPKTATGLVGQYSKGIESTPAGVLDSALNGIRARIGFDELQRMRAASPTGGALGSVSDFENRMLSSVMGGITTGLPADVLKMRLRRLERVYDAVINKGAAAAKAEFDKPENDDPLGLR